MKLIEGDERAELIAEIERRIEADTQVIAAPERHAVWERGWQEALDKFRANPCVESLVPAFVRNGQPMRINSEFWHVPDGYELQHIRSVQKEIAYYMAGCEHIAEFGCGTGFNLFAVGGRWPMANLTTAFAYCP